MLIFRVWATCDNTPWAKPKEVTHLEYQTILNTGTRLTFALTFQQVGLFLDNYSKNILGIVVDKRDYHKDSGKLPYYYSRGWHLGIFGVGMCRPGLQIGTPFYRPHPPPPPPPPLRATTTNVFWLKRVHESKGRMTRSSKCYPCINLSEPNFS